MTKYALLAIVVCVFAVWWGMLCYDAGEHDGDGNKALLVVLMFLAFGIVGSWALVVVIFNLIQSIWGK